MTRHKVLLVLHADGFIEAFADSDVDVRTVVMPDVPGGETLAEEYVELTIPRAYREVYFPGNRRAVDNVRRLLPSQLMQQQLDRELMDGLNAVCNLLDDEHKREGYRWGIEFDE